MDELIARLERAGGPDRQLDNAIEEAIDLPKPTNPDDLPDYPPHFTASIDDALALIPEGMGYELGAPATNGGPHDGRPWADVWYEGDGPREIHVNAATTPLALCVAALIARRLGLVAFTSALPDEK